MKYTYKGEMLMKKTNISIPFEEKKLRAARFYAARKGAVLEDELEEFLQKTYEKYVPRDTREYLEQDVPGAKPKAKAAAAGTPKSVQTATPAATPSFRPQG